MNITRVITISFCLIVSQLFPSCNPDKEINKLNIFAAASLKDVLTKTAEVYKKETGIKLNLNFASSGLLARQIEHGAEVDFFFSWISFSGKIFREEFDQFLIGTFDITFLKRNTD